MTWLYSPAKTTGRRSAGSSSRRSPTTTTARPNTSAGSSRTLTRTARPRPVRHAAGPKPTPPKPSCAAWTLSSTAGSRGGSGAGEHPACEHQIRGAVGRVKMARENGQRVTRSPEEDEELGFRLYATLAGESFTCEICHGFHPLREHQ